MEAQELRNLQEAYLNVYEDTEQLDEISQRTATRAYARRATNEFENDGDYKGDFTKSGKSKADATKRRIERKFGEKAGQHANRAAHANTFGRKSFSMPKVSKEQADLYDIILSHLLDEGYAETPEAAEVIMVNMSEDWRESIVEAEVLAAKGGVPGTVQVKKTKEGGFLGIGAKTVSRPVPGTFKPKDVSSSDAARYNVGVDRRFGGAAPGKEPTKSALSTQKTAQRSGHSGYMQVRDPGSLPNTGLPGRASPGRASDQNFAKGKPRNY